MAAILTVRYEVELLYLWIWRDLCILLLLRDSTRNNHYACVMKVYAGKATPACLADLAKKKYGGSIISPPYTY